MGDKIKEYKEDIEQGEINLRIGNMDISIFYTENVILIKAEEPQLEWLSTVSYEQKKHGIKTIAWDKMEGLMWNKIRTY